MTPAETEPNAKVFSFNKDGIAGSEEESALVGKDKSLSPMVNFEELVDIALGEFRINISQLQFKKTILSTSPTQLHNTIHAGKCNSWDVHIHTSCPTNAGQIASWLSDVQRLSQTRHDNLVLYMGASTDPFTIITSSIKPESSLVSTMSRRSIPTREQVAILQQTANAIAYLHSRGIEHGRLSPQNIFMEARAKVSLLDYDPTALNLQYLSPEIIREMAFPTGKSHSVDDVLRSPAGDVYAFGSLAHFLANSGKLPLDQLPLHTTWTVIKSGGLVNMGRFQLAGLDWIARQCWAPQPEKRPAFSSVCEMLSLLYRTIPAISRSISEPIMLSGKRETGLLATTSS